MSHSESAHSAQDAKMRAPSKEFLAELAKPSKTYTRHAWMAMAGLAIFILFYFLLAGWFLLTAYRLTFDAGAAGGGMIMSWIVGLCSGILAVFMLKGFFFVKRGSDNDSLEITAKQQPRLFAFLNALADEAGAPRPHRVYLSAHVNAAVFYDLSILNLIFPSKKNLVIGLGLVNVLNLGELRAVLAHEFGHFAQKAMAVGRWVYVAQQVAGNLVARRDAWDNFLSSWGRMDFRIAWVAWCLQLVVWAIRSIVDTAFGVVIVIQRALSREMEMQADLVAVSLTGSDALVHALHRLQAADDSWSRAASFAFDEKARDRIAPDLFALQSYLLEKMANLLNDDSYATVPPLPEANPEKHRVFKAELARPPKMWLTHPLNHEREENAKRHYVAANIDDSPAWDMFDDVQDLRSQVTAKYLQGDLKNVVPTEELTKALDRQFGREHLKRQYRGVYYGRSPVRAAKNVGDLYDTKKAFSLAELDSLYPESITRVIEQLGQVEKELEQLRAIEKGNLQANDGRINLRGREIKRRELPKIIKRLERESAKLEERLSEHDKQCRSVHMAAAKLVQNGWPEYLKALLKLIHYADHSASNIRDAHGYLNNTVAVVTATRKVDEKGVQRIIDAANVLQRLIADVYAQAHQVTLDNIVRQRLDVETWKDALGELKLGEATRENINDWLGVVNGWVEQTANLCGALRLHSLEQLLISEAVIARHVRQCKQIILAPVAPNLPFQYDVLLPGDERKRQTKLGWWARFQLADGRFPAVARFVVAMLIVNAVLGFGGSIGQSELTIYNGLGRAVAVKIEGKQLTIQAFSNAKIELPSNRVIKVETHTEKGVLIENFDAELHGAFSHYVYNVAAAAPMVEWTNVYGNASQRAERELGAERWFSTKADYLFTEPPQTVSSKSGGATRDILSAFPNESATAQLNMVHDKEQRDRIIQAHARWDGIQMRHVGEWLDAAQAMPDFDHLLAQRLEETPDDVVLLRMVEDRADEKTRPEVCNKMRQRADANVENGDLRYLADRCIDDDVTRLTAFRHGHEQWPDNAWYTFANAFLDAENAEWAKALEGYTKANSALPAMHSKIVVEQIRIIRLGDAVQNNKLVVLARGDRALQTMLAIEQDQPLATKELKAYQALNRGELEKAVNLVEGVKEREARILRLAAASVHASEKLRQRALALPPDVGIDTNTVWAAMGLAMREYRDPKPYLQSLGGMPPKILQRYDDFLAKIRMNDIPGADNALNGLSPELRAQAYVVAVISMGDRVPNAWRNRAKRLLFASERPYLG